MNVLILVTVVILLTAIITWQLSKKLRDSTETDATLLIIDRGPTDDVLCAVEDMISSPLVNRLCLEIDKLKRQREREKAIELMNKTTLEQQKIKLEQALAETCFFCGGPKESE